MIYEEEMQKGGLKLSSRKKSVATTQVSRMREDPTEIKRDRSGNVLSGSGIAVEQPYQRLKLCKRGHRDAIVERECGVTFEDLPMWMWTMRLAEWSKIFITDTDELRLRQYHVSTWEFAKEKLVIVAATAIPGLSFVDLWLVSGCLKFIQEFQGPVGTPTVGWLSTSGRRNRPLMNHDGSG